MTQSDDTKNLRFELHVAIANFIDSSAQELSLTERDFLQETITTFVFDVVEKYAKGAKEHSGNLFACDLQNEIYNEIKDLLIYSFAYKLKHKYQEERQHEIDSRPSNPDNCRRD